MCCPEDVLPNRELVPHAIHIPIDVFTGKTSNSCFVECRSAEHAMLLVRQRRDTPLLGRAVGELSTSIVVL